MNIKSISLFVILVFLQFEAHASSCSTVYFDNSKWESKDIVLELIGHNGKSVNSNKKNYRAISKGTQPYFMGKGEHTVTFNIWKKRHYINFYRQKKFAKNGVVDISAKEVAPLLTKTASLSVDDNDQHYQFKLIKNKQDVLLKSVKQRPFKCEVKNENVFTSYNELSKAELPQNLVAKLNLLGKNIIAKNIPFHTQSMSFSSIFGASFTSGDKLTVAKITPLSFADKIGLKVGDTILTFGNEEPVNEVSFTSLNKYVNDITINGDVIITIARNNNSKVLKAKYIPSLIPEYSLKVTHLDIGNANQSTLASNQSGAIDIEKSILEVSHLLIKSGFQDDISYKTNFDSQPNITLNISLASFLAFNTEDMNTTQSILYDRMFYELSILKSQTQSNRTRMTAERVKANRNSLGDN